MDENPYESPREIPAEPETEKRPSFLRLSLAGALLGWQAGGLAGALAGGIGWLIVFGLQPLQIETTILRLFLYGIVGATWGLAAGILLGSFLAVCSLLHKPPRPWPLPVTLGFALLGGGTLGFLAWPATGSPESPAGWISLALCMLITTSCAALAGWFFHKNLERFFPHNQHSE